MYTFRETHTNTSIHIHTWISGPRAPAPACNYSVKLYHCQEAGAVGVVFVDW
jgi:hypothetical protein